MVSWGNIYKSILNIKIVLGIITKIGYLHEHSMKVFIFEI